MALWVRFQRWSGAVGGSDLEPAVVALALDESEQWLFSASADKAIKVFDLKHQRIQCEALPFQGRWRTDEHLAQANFEPLPEALIFPGWVCSEGMRPHLVTLAVALLAVTVLAEIGESFDYMLTCGINRVLFREGLLVYIKEVGDHWFRCLDIDGVIYECHVDIQKPQQPRIEQWNQWRRQLQRCLRLSCPVKLLGYEQICEGQVRLTSNSYVISQVARMSDRQVSQLRIFEWCSGGYGGWMRGAKFLQQQGWPVETTGSADCDPCMVTLWNENSKEIHKGSDHCPRCVQLDIKSRQDWEIPVQQESDSVTLSTPCKSFSLAGNQAGWLNSDGQCLAVALFMARLHDYPIVIVENVANLWMDRDFRQHLIKILEFLGLRIAFHRTISLSVAHPAERSRLLLVLEPETPPNQVSLPVLDFLQTLNCRHRTLWDAARWIEVPDELLQSLILPADVLQQYANRRRLPNNMKSQMTVDSKEEVLWVRTVRANQVMPAGCIMAMYNRQHTFDDDKPIYGSLVRHKFFPVNIGPPHQIVYRFFHAAELAMAMGQSTPLILPRNDNWSTMAVGNSISEFHAIAGLGIALRMIGHDIDITGELQLHQQACFTNQTIHWEWDQNWIAVRRKSDASDEVPPPTEMRTIQCRLTSDDIGDPNFQLHIASNATPKQVIRAEQTLQGPGVQIDAMCDEEMNEIPEETVVTQTMGIIQQRNASSVNLGFMCQWTNGSCWFDLSPHEQFARVTFQGTPFQSFQWVDAESNEVEPNQLIGHCKGITTKDVGFWPMSKSDNQVLIVSIQEGELTYFPIQHGHDEVVESIMFAEQILRGPCDRISKVSDKFGQPLDPSQSLQELSTVVIHWVSTHNCIRIRIQDRQQTKEQWVPKGTRLFQVEPHDPQKVLVDPAGVEVAWDTPVLQSMNLTLDHGDEESDVVSVSDTVPFHVETPPSIMQQRSSEMSIRDIVRQNCLHLRRQIRHTVAGSQSVDLFTARRLDMMCDWGPAVADDEMAWFMRKCSLVTDLKVFGVYRWSPDTNSWEHGRYWDQTCDVGINEDGLAMWCIHQHWVAVQLQWEENPQSCRLCYVSDMSFQDSLIESWITQHVQTRKADVMHLKCTNVHGWCGFTAMQWMFHDCNVKFPLPTMDQSQICRAKFDEVVKAERSTKYHDAMQRIPDNIDHQWVQSMRTQFMMDQFQYATSPMYYGLGNDEPKGATALKSLGKLAAILIGKGAGQEESLRIAQHIVDNSATQAKHIVQQKDQKAFMLICEYCVRNDLKMSRLETTQAAQKLQQFFRMKYGNRTNKKEVDVLDLRKIQFDQRSFMVQNGEYQSVDPQWSPVTKGIAVAQMDEVRRYVEKGDLLTQESNTAIVAEEVAPHAQIKTERITVQVTDGKSNQAIISATLIHFGARPIIRVPTTDGEVDTQETATIAVQIYKDMVEPDVWSALLGGPVKVLLRTLQPSRDDTPVLNIWSRRWSSGSAQVEPRMANEFSVLMSIPSNQSNEWLRKSGTLNLPCFVSLRRGQKDVHAMETHRVIWIANTQAVLGKVPEHSGIVHRRPSSFGIRVATDIFEDQWTILKGGSAMPSLIRTQYRYTIAGFPSGITNGQLEQWGESIGWPIRFLRKVGESKILVGSEKQKPTKALSMNGQLLLILDHVDASRPPKTVLIGRLDMKEKEPNGWSSSNDPWHGVKLGGAKQIIEETRTSPWGNYVPTSMGSKPHSSIDDKPSGAQTARIDAIEQEIQTIKDTMKSQQQETKDNFLRVEREISSVSSSLKLSLQEALQEQSQPSDALDRYVTKQSSAIGPISARRDGKTAALLEGDRGMDAKINQSASCCRCASGEVGFSATGRCDFCILDAKGRTCEGYRDELLTAPASPPKRQLPESVKRHSAQLWFCLVGRSWEHVAGGHLPRAG
eukprot:Skav217438  [mRNA]  locus=scaffold1729:386153:403995:+ [translate_table: standard]